MANAAKYSAPGTIVSIKLEKLDGLAKLAIHNEGNPIPVEEQKLLFQPFLRAKAAQDSGKKGWGLGLTLVKGIAEAHGGTVTVESSAEKGTTFTLSIPLDFRLARVA